jgi:hypothetical protein
MTESGRGDSLEAFALARADPRSPAASAQRPIGVNASLARVFPLQPKHDTERAGRGGPGLRAHRHTEKAWNGRRGSGPDCVRAACLPACLPACLRRDEGRAPSKG